MAKVNYMARIRTSGISCMMSLMCAYCYRDGKRVGFFGVDPKGRTTGNRDHSFLKEIWQAAVKHMGQEHGMKMILTGAGQWKAVSSNEASR